MTTAPQPSDEADWARSERIKQAAEAVMGRETPDIGWMTGECGHSFLAMFGAAQTKLQMKYLRRGMDPEEAKRSVSHEILLLAFDLGMRVGKEVAAADQMREMFGDDDPFKGLDL